MAIIKKYNIAAEEIGEEVLEDTYLLSEVNAQMVKDYLVAIRKNRRQWSANTKGRKEISCSEQKPHPQKGTGRARQGFLGAPQFKGGGIVFGPKPKFDQHRRINQKERQKTISYLLSEKIASNCVRLIDLEKSSIEKTKQIADCLKKLQINGKRILVLAPTTSSDRTKAWRRCMKNIPKAQYVPILQLNGYDLALSQEILLFTDAFDSMKALLEKGKSYGQKKSI